jgi:hypothetical protein
MEPPKRVAIAQAKSAKIVELWHSQRLSAISKGEKSQD